MSKAQARMHTLAGSKINHAHGKQRAESYR